jgi:alpha-L-fucosidase
MSSHCPEPTRRAFLLALSAVPSAAGAVTAPPVPYGALPSERQVGWSELEFYNFLHFTVNTFTDREWGNGDEDPAIFNPSAFDADAIVEILEASGSKGVILTAKHHDGFCLWPTRTTEHSIRHSPYKKGKGDIVRELSEAARRRGMKFGVYLSPWDRNQATYGTPAYIPIYRQQLRELLTEYGSIFEIWHDGANGGKGFYGGANETRIIDKLHYYDWANTWKLERQLQPGAAIFSDVGPDVRWVGNEKGIAGETCWATYTPRSENGGPGAPGDVVEAEATTGTRGGEYWMPAECDVSIRPGWFWHAKENGEVKTADRLMELYFESVGRGASFLLNVPPDRRGLIDEADAASLREFGKRRRALFASDLARRAKITASNVRGGQDGLFSPGKLVDGDRFSYWATDDGVTSAEVVLTWSQPVSLRLVRLRENIRLGQRVHEFRIEFLKRDSWTPFSGGTSIGISRIVAVDAPLTTRGLRVQVRAPVCPALSEVSVF